MAADAGLWERRPLRADDVEYASADASLLWDAYPAVCAAAAGEGLSLRALQDASEARAASAAANEGRRSVVFHAAEQFRKASAELLRFTQPEAAVRLEAPVLQFDWRGLVALLPEQLATQLASPAATDGGGREAPLVERIADVVLDPDRRPLAWTLDQVRARSRHEPGLPARSGAHCPCLLLLHRSASGWAPSTLG